MKDELFAIIRSLIGAVNPVTGELFDKNILTDDPEISRAILVLALSTQENLILSRKSESTNSKNRRSDLIWAKLKAWRLEKAIELKLPAYCVFSDKELWSIAEGDIEIKEDLLFIKGIKKTRYELYGEDLFEIIKSCALEEPIIKKAPNFNQMILANEDSVKAHNIKADFRNEEIRSVLVNCRKCKLYRRDDCIGESSICELFEVAPDISKEEMDNWPKFGDASRNRDNQRDNKQDRDGNDALGYWDK